MKFKEVLLKELLRRGIKTVFGVPGRENEKIFFNEVPEIEYITTRVEFTAGIAADAAGRMTQKPQVCFATMGPGATNLTTAVASACLNKSPVIYITSQLEHDDIIYNYTHQCVDQEKIMEPVTKWSYELKSANELEDVLSKAFDVCMTEPLGPVHIAIPVDFYDTEISYTSEKQVCVPEIKLPAGEVDCGLIEKVKDDINSAKKPLIILGQEVIRTGAVSAVKDFIVGKNIPFISTANAKGVVPFENPLNYGSASCYMEGILHYNALSDIFDDVDMIICIGYQYVDDLLPKMWERGIEKKLVSISTLGTEKIRNKFKPEYELVGNLEDVFVKLSAADIKPKEIIEKQTLKAKYKEILEPNDESGKDLSPGNVMGVLNQNIEDGIIVTDIGYYRHHAILFGLPNRINAFLSDTGLSSFGTGLPSAIGVQAIERDKNVFVICGDGGFHSSSCDLATLAKYDFPVVVIVLNSSSYTLIDNYQHRGGGSNNSITDLAPVDFVKLAEANGCVGKKATCCKELDRILKERDKNKPLVVDVAFTYDDDFKISF